MPVMQCAAVHSGNSDQFNMHKLERIELALPRGSENESNKSIVMGDF